jgi:predicted acetyltransferase
MGISIVIPVEDQWLEMLSADARGFGWVPAPGDAETRRPTIDLSRFRIAVDRGQIIGVAGSFSFDMTLPGGSTVPASGVTWVSVSATHRRQGVLTRLIDACHVDSDERGEPVAILFASESGIYERFGYGIASQVRVAVIQRASARFRPDIAVSPGAVRFVEGDDAHAHRVRAWEPFRRGRAGELSRSALWHDLLTELAGKPANGMSPAFCLAHADGYAMYRVAEKWTDGIPENRLEVSEVVANTPQAHRDLWSTILGVDLVATIRCRSLAVDDPLPYYLTDSRSVRTISLHDGLWANVRDAAVCFGARQYGTTDRLVIEVGGRRLAIESDGAEASCRSVRTRPDLVVDQASLGALLLGGVRPSQLVAAGRVSARSDAIARRADAFFLLNPAPHCQTYF